MCVTSYTKVWSLKLEVRGMTISSGRINEAGISAASLSQALLRISHTLYPSRRFAKYGKYYSKPRAKMYIENSQQADQADWEEHLKMLFNTWASR